MSRRLTRRERAAGRVRHQPPPPKELPVLETRPGVEQPVAFVSGPRADPPPLSPFDTDPLLVVSAILTAAALKRRRQAKEGA